MGREKIPGEANFQEPNSKFQESNLEFALQFISWFLEFGFWDLKLESCGCGLKRHHRHFRTNAEAKAQAEAHALVDIHLRLRELIQARGEAAGFAAEGTAQARPIDLTAVRVSAQHQIAPPSVQFLCRSGIVRQHDAWHRGR